MAESRFIPSSPPPFPPELRGSVRWVPWKGITEETISPSLFAVALPPGLRMLPGIWLLPTTDVKNMPWGMTFHHWIADMFRRCGCYVQLVPIFEADGRFADNISNSKRVRDIQRYYDGLQDGLLGLDVCEPEETGHYVYMTGNLRYALRAIKPKHIEPDRPTQHMLYWRLIEQNSFKRENFWQWVHKDRRGRDGGEAIALHFILHADVSEAARAKFAEERAKGPNSMAMFRPLWELAREGKTTMSLIPLLKFCMEQGLTVRPSVPMPREGLTQESARDALIQLMPSLEELLRWNTESGNSTTYRENGVFRETRLPSGGYYPRPTRVRFSPPPLEEPLPSSSRPLPRLTGPLVLEPPITPPGHGNHWYPTFGPPPTFERNT